MLKRHWAVERFQEYIRWDDKCNNKKKGHAMKGKAKKTNTAPVEKTGEEMIKDYGRIEAVFEMHLDGHLSAVQALGRISAILRGVNS